MWGKVSRIWSPRIAQASPAGTVSACRRIVQRPAPCRVPERARVPEPRARACHSSGSRSSTTRIPCTDCWATWHWRRVGRGASYRGGLRQMRYNATNCRLWPFVRCPRSVHIPLKPIAPRPKHRASVAATWLSARIRYSASAESVSGAFGIRAWVSASRRLSHESTNWQPISQDCWVGHAYLHARERA